jgi:hypothetical protein
MNNIKNLKSELNYLPRKFSNYINPNTEKFNYFETAHNLIRDIKVIDGQPITIFSICTGDGKLELYILYYLINNYKNDSRLGNKNIYLYVFDPLYYGKGCKSFRTKFMNIIRKINENSNVEIIVNFNSIEIEENYSEVQTIKISNIIQNFNKTKNKDINITINKFFINIFRQLEDSAENIGLVLSVNCSYNFYYANLNIIFHKIPKNNGNYNKIKKYLNDNFYKPPINELFRILRSKSLEGTNYYRISTTFENNLIRVYPIHEYIHEFKTF